MQTQAFEVEGESEKLRKKLYVVFALVIFFVLVDGIHTASSRSTKIDVTAENLRLICTPSYSICDQTYVLNDIFSVTAGQIFAESFTLRSPSVFGSNVSNITVQTDGFSVVTINPSLPIQLNEGKTAITVIIKAPYVSYTGPIEIDVYLDLPMPWA